MDRSVKGPDMSSNGLEGRERLQGGGEVRRGAGGKERSHGEGGGWEKQGEGDRGLGEGGGGGVTAGADGWWNGKDNGDQDGGGKGTAVNEPQSARNRHRQH